MVAINHTQTTPNILQRSRWYVFVRWFFLIAITAPGLTSVYYVEGWSIQAQRDTTLAVIALASNAVFYVLVTLLRNNDRQLRYLAGCWIILDSLLVTYLIFINGGIESRSPILYTIPILISAALFGRRAIYITTFGSIATYTFIIVADYHNIIHSVGAIDPALRSNLPYVINTVCFFPAILLVVGLAVDFITRLLLEKERQANEHLEAMVRAQEVAKIGSWEWDATTNKITCSKELFKLFELKDTSKELDYTAFLSIVHPDDTDVADNTLRNAYKLKRDFKFEYKIILKDGTVRYLASQGQTLRDQSGKSHKMVGTVKDITETKHLDDAKREFVALASHQLRTPATGVKAYLSLLLDSYAGPLSRKQSNFAKQAYESNNRQLQIVEDLLSLATIESGKLTAKKELVNINEIIKKCLPNHRPRLTLKKQKLTIHNRAKNVHARADPSHILMALDNLIANAITYTPEKGTITIMVTASQRSVYIEVSDTGIGIAKKDLASLFKKFSRIDIPTVTGINGSGLGLYLAQYVIQHNHGTISVRSQVGSGSTFKIRLPLSKNHKTTD